MPIFDEHNLKDEELFGGFDANDDDTFSLNPAKEKPVEAKQSEVKPEKPKEKPAPKVITPPIHKIEKEKKKENSGFAGALAAAIIVMLLAFAGFYYWFTQVNSPFLFLQYSSIATNNNNELQSELSPTDENETVEIIEEKDVPDNNEVMESDTVTLASTEHKNTQNKIKPKTLTGKQQNKQAITEIEPEEIILKKTKPVVTNKKTPKKSTTPKPVYVKTNKVVTASKPVETKSNPKKTIEQLTKPKASKTGIYTIEAYSSYSYDDAKMWQQKLNRRNLNAYIVTQRIKDRVLYKVRFGKFTDAKEARIIAMKLGLSRSYIQRIK